MIDKSWAKKLGVFFNEDLLHCLFRMLFIEFIKLERPLGHVSSRVLSSLKNQYGFLKLEGEYKGCFVGGHLRSCQPSTTSNIGFYGDGIHVVVMEGIAVMLLFLSGTAKVVEECSFL